MQAENIIVTIPDNIPELQNLVIDLLSKIETKDAELKNKDNKISFQNTEIESLRHKLQSQLAARFASKSEKDIYYRGNLFDEAEVSAQTELENIEEADQDITVAAYTRKKTGRKSLPKDLPREIIIHDLSEDEKICSCGCNLHKIGEDKSEQLEWIPAQVKVIEHVRIKYACRSCEEGVKSAAMPKLPIPKSIATPGLLAEILISKYEDHLPLYRQEKILQRMEVDITRATLSTWMIKCGELLAPLIPLSKQYRVPGDIGRNVTLCYVKS